MATRDCRLHFRHSIIEAEHVHQIIDTLIGNNCFRMGVTSIPEERIRNGVSQLRDLIREMVSGKRAQLDFSNPKLLKGAALEQALSGATLIWMMAHGEPCTIDLLPDGSMWGHAGHAKEDQDVGHWWIEDDRWCRRWDHWAFAERRRYYVVMNEQQIQLFNDACKRVDSLIIHRST